MEVYQIVSSGSFVILQLVRAVLDGHFRAWRSK